MAYGTQEREGIMFFALKGKTDENPYLLVNNGDLPQQNYLSGKIDGFDIQEVETDKYGTFKQCKIKMSDGDEKYLFQFTIGSMMGRTLCNCLLTIDPSKEGKLFISPYKNKNDFNTVYVKYDDEAVSRKYDNKELEKKYKKGDKRDTDKMDADYEKELMEHFKDYLNKGAKKVEQSKPKEKDLKSTTTADDLPF